ncbi:MAG TPA: NAD(P)H-binding protein [Puia sp.]|nr:NAD(P)H-binding protein [Puia sp.]
MRLLIIGAGGGIGCQCVEQALAAGHSVTAVLRNPAKLSFNHPNLLIVKGDVTQAFSFADHYAEKDAVISAIGVSGGLFGDRPTTLYSEGAKNIIREMQQSSGCRVFFISASAVENSPLLPFFVRLAAKYIIQKLLKNMYADLLRMEGIVKKSALNWTIVRPPQLTDKPLTGKYRMAVNQFLKNGLKISRADAADFMLRHVQDKALYQSTVEIAY